MMDNRRNDAITTDFHAFLDEFRSVEPPLDLEHGLVQYLALCREAAFRAGWAAGQHWQAHCGIKTTPVRSTILSMVRTLVCVGDRAWVQPQAIIEYMETGELFVDPLFPITRHPSDRYCIELTLTGSAPRSIVGVFARSSPSRSAPQAESRVTHRARARSSSPGRPSQPIRADNPCP
jgi:hypothetical protein